MSRAAAPGVSKSACSDKRTPAISRILLAASISLASGAPARKRPRRRARSIASRLEPNRAAAQRAAASVSVRMPRPAPRSQKGSVACCHSASLRGATAEGFCGASQHPVRSCSGVDRRLRWQHRQVVFQCFAHGSPTNAQAACAASGSFENSMSSLQSRHHFLYFFIRFS